MSFLNENIKFLFYMWNFLEVINYYDKLGIKKLYILWIKYMNCIIWKFLKGFFGNWL